jgi:hypothetical protein
MNDSEHPSATLADVAAVEPEPRPAPNDVGPVAAVDLLIEEAQAAAAQEIDLLKALLAAGAQAGRNVSIFAAAAMLVALVALMTLAIGTMFGIAQYLGFGAATAIVVGTLVFVGALLVLGMRSQIARFRKAARGD